MWLLLALVSALLLGLYDIAKKRSLIDNAVLPVLLLATMCGSALMLLPLGASVFYTGDIAMAPVWYIGSIRPRYHLLIAAKAALVTLSWVLAYFSLKHLPISIVAPIRASAPVWTALGAVLLFGEQPSAQQWGGITIIIGSYLWFSLIGRREGISFRRNKMVWALILATLFGAASALYDKFLLQQLQLSPITLQVWFSLYLVVIQVFVVLLLWYPNRDRTTPFVWRWTIAAIGVLLVSADFFYFWAVHEPGALIALISPVRRTGAVVSFVIGGALFAEKNRRQKALALIGVLAGVALVLLK
jgi:drug/metabolite transporter (DMT)-like permease